MVSMNIDSFLNECSKSGDSAYAALKLILRKLEDPSSRSDARIFLANVQRRFENDETSLDCFTKYHFRIHDIILTDFEGTHNRKKLTVMEIPSIFTPEDWSFTFYEGINRHPSSMFKDKIISELGCGNGWISISIADKWSPAKVYGLDINPRAVKVAWINLYLNALDENGNPIFDEERKTLLDRVEFYESDLLGYCGENNIQLDQIVACIPQILNPNPEAMSKLVTENASEEFLYDLSNYCALQGFVEDQFGLGLIARAVEEGIAVLKPTGTMVFNMGGRPGQAVCKRLFERRGFHIKKLWQTKILQAADTDISALVDIEKNSRHRFEFFMGLVSDQPICARTASAYIGTGGQISHSLSVFSCRLHQPNQVKTIFDFLKNGFKDVSSSLDLSFEDDSVAEEKIPFLSYLAGILKDNLYFPYEPPAGSMNFRKLTAGFLKSYHHIPLGTENVTVFPSRSIAIENVLRLFSPRLAIVDEHLTRQLPKHWLASMTIENVADDENTADALMVIEAPRQSDLMIELIKKLKPQVVITGMAQYEAITNSAFENLLHATGEIGSRLFLDISDHLELSSLPKSNGVLKYLSGNVLPSHAAIICGLIKNKVYYDLEVAFVISEDEYICNALSKTVELLEGHTALFSQYYYGCLFHELLAFQISGRRPPTQRESANTGFKDTSPSSSSISVLNEAELSIHDPENPSVIHMNIDQNFLPVPSSVKASIFESFARQHITEAETDVQLELHQLLRSNYGFITDNSSEFIYGNNPLALFNRLVLCCIQERGTLLFPSGTNGHYISAAKFMNANMASIPTESETGFKIAPKMLEIVISKVSKPWVYISGPTVNPTGSLYSNEEIKELLSVCARHGARVIIDTSFSGLEFNAENWSGWDLECDLLKLKSSHVTFCVSLIGGLSFEMLSGGLGFGYLVLNDSQLIELFQSYPSLSKPHSTVKYAVKKLMGLRMQKNQAFFMELAKQKEILKNQAEQLSKALKSCGWDVLDCFGGGSMVAKPSSYIGKKLKIEGFESELSSSNIREALVKATGLCINSESWTGIPDYCRLTFALESVEFQKALKCIKSFEKLVLEGQ